MSFVKTGGRLWSPQLVGWGSPGRQKDRSLVGYHPKKEGRGRLTDADRARLTVDVWAIQAVYALFNDDRLLYVGEGILGERLLEHWRNDELAGRWDSFTWLSPWHYVRPTTGVSKAGIEVAPETTLSFEPKAAVELLELAAIHLGNPTDNSQRPDSEKDIVWLEQVRADTAASSLEEKLDQVLEALARMERGEVARKK